MRECGRANWSRECQRQQTIVASPGNVIAVVVVVVKVAIVVVVVVVEVVVVVVVVTVVVVVLLEVVEVVVEVIVVAFVDSTHMHNSNGRGVSGMSPTCVQQWYGSTRESNIVVNYMHMAICFAGGTGYI